MIEKEERGHKPSFFMYWRIADFIWKFIVIEDEEEWKQADIELRMCLHLVISILTILGISFMLDCVNTTLISVILYNVIKQLSNLDLYDSDSLERCTIISTIIFCGIGFLSSIISSCILMNSILSIIGTIGFVYFSITKNGKKFLKLVDKLLTI